MKVAATVLAAALLGGARADAQQCDQQRSASACFSRLVDPDPAGASAATTRAAVAATARAIDTGVANKTTGSETATPGTAATTSAIKDFLPPLAGAFSIPGLGASARGLDLAFNLRAH